jgi:hypothetical protein
MTLYEEIIAIFSELEDSDNFRNGTIHLQDDSDGTGAYIKAWNYSKPLPKSLTQYLR